MIEITLLFPVLLIVISGLLEFGFLLNQYLSIIDAARNAARFSSDGLYMVREPTNKNCEGANPTSDFYFQTACVVLQELKQEKPEVTIDLSQEDDIVISAISVQGSSTPSLAGWYPVSSGWSYAEAQNGDRNQNSRLSNSEVLSKLDVNAPSTGLLIVEITYHYNQMLRLPWITAFIPNPVPLHAYTIMPLVSAEPDTD